MKISADTEIVVGIAGDYQRLTIFTNEYRRILKSGKQFYGSIL